MQTPNYIAQRAYALVVKLIEHILDLFLRGQAIEDKIKKLREKLQVINDHNPQLRDLYHDCSENNRMFLILLVTSLSIIIDFVLIANPISVLCKGVHLPGFLVYLIPLVLVIVEIGFAYTSAIRSNSGEPDSWIGRNLQYCIITLLVALSIVMVLYLINSYNEQFDGQFLHFLLLNTILQIILIIPSVLLHLWVIRHAEDITEAVAYFKYAYDRYKKESHIERLEKANRKRHYPKFVKGVYTLVQKKEVYEAKYGNGRFDKLVPLPLAKAVNTVMGRVVFTHEIEILDNQ